MVELEKLTDQLSGSVDAEKINQYLRNAQKAVDLAAAYPQLNKDIVAFCTLLFPLVKDGLLNIHRPEQIVTLFEEVNVEQGMQAYRVLVNSQGSFATGEAKIAQYFYQ